AGNGGQKMSQYSWFTVYQKPPITKEISNRMAKIVIFKYTLITPNSSHVINDNTTDRILKKHPAIVMLDLQIFFIFIFNISKHFIIGS
ncbi:hypothetical protein, partial [Merdimonas faecis]|uniref:hypothetical protein n=1 Tax=Merdimonas faecis TaxID=1653435 RepID=UPI0022E5647E